MPASVPAFADLLSAIDPEETYVVRMHDDSGWARPVAAEHAHLTGVDVLHAVRRGLRSYRLELGTQSNGIVTLTNGTASVRFIPHKVYEDTICTAEDCEESTEDDAPAVIPAPAPYMQGDLRQAAAAAYQMVHQPARQNDARCSSPAEVPSHAVGLGIDPLGRTLEGCGPSRSRNTKFRARDRAWWGTLGVHRR